MSEQKKPLTLDITPKLENTLATLKAQISEAQQKYQMILATIFECSPHSGKNLTVLNIGGGKIVFRETEESLKPELIKDKKEETPS